MEVVSDAASRKVLIGEDPQQHLRPVKRYEREVGGGGERGEGRREGRGRLRYVERNSWYRSLSIL